MIALQTLLAQWSEQKVITCIMQIKVKFKKYQRYLLFPLALFYWGLVFLRNLFYKLDFFIVHKVDCKVLSIGNLTLGGTGKTPLVVFFAIYLISFGKKVAVGAKKYVANREVKFSTNEAEIMKFLIPLSEINTNELIN